MLIGLSQNGKLGRRFSRRVAVAGRGVHLSQMARQAQAVHTSRHDNVAEHDIDAIIFGSVRLANGGARTWFRAPIIAGANVVDAWPPRGTLELSQHLMLAASDPHGILMRVSRPSP